MSARTPTSEDGFQEGGIVIAVTFESAAPGAERMSVLRRIAPPLECRMWVRHATTAETVTRASEISDLARTSFGDALIVASAQASGALVSGIRLRGIFAVHADSCGLRYLQDGQHSCAALRWHCPAFRRDVRTTAAHQMPQV